MTVKSPVDGIVYYGKCVAGQVQRFDQAGRQPSPQRRDPAEPGGDDRGSAAADVHSRDGARRTTALISGPGLKGIATPTGYPDLKLPVTLDDVSDIPTAPGSFDARLNVELDRKAKRLMPGMTCKVKLVPYLKKDAITVPPKAVIDRRIGRAEALRQRAGQGRQADRNAP